MKSQNCETVSHNYSKEKKKKKLYLTIVPYLWNIDIFFNQG